MKSLDPKILIDYSEFDKKSPDLSTMNTGFYDLWNNAPSEPKSELIPELEDYYLQQLKKKQPKRIKKSRNSNIPAVEPPHPGSSYNPALDDHMMLLTEANNIEKMKLKRERRLERDLKLPPANQMVTQEDKMKELKEGLGPSPSDVEDDSDQEAKNDAYRPAVAPIRAENRKLSAVRKREKLRKKLEREQRKLKLKRMRESDVYRIRSFKREIKKHEHDRMEEKTRKNRRRELLSKIKPPKLSAIPFEPPDPEVQLSSELRGSLLELKPEGSLLEDRYKSLLKRGVVEPRTKQSHKRKHKRKKYEKRSHRDMPEGYLPR